MQYKATTTKFPEKMVATAPVAIGTQGTVGSLKKKEIEYFSKFEIEKSASSRKPQGKKRRGNSGFLPSICSAVEVSDSNSLRGIPGFSYRILKDDLKDMQV
ncbi:hypothetical protein OIU74_006884 [Salix koriyanagi]|uniref:Uncharacterized protein n=1 Tax=Salix koriyanagi TaxID=2511006 RepID=A0A9Q0UFK5_9ROSI|nr:hypothetical protein OIU74_006884 [Salix koriyanagi]